VKRGACTTRLAFACRAIAVAALLAVAPSGHAQGLFDSAPKPGPDGRYKFAEPPAFAPARHANGHPVIVHKDDLEREIRAHSPHLVGVWIAHQARVVPGMQWDVKMLDWYGRFLSWMGVKYRSDTWDCEDYSRLLVALSNVEMVRYWNADVRLPMGWMSVMPEHAWAGVPAGTKHMLVLVRSAEGLAVFEPQNGQRTLLADYPNRHRILEVYFP
jgi:hypothetical protein